MGMYTIKPNLKPNGWYRAYLRNTARLVTVKYIGIGNDGIQFADQEQKTYSPRDFYFWKRTEEN